MDRRLDQTAKGLGLGACELSVLCAGVIVLTIMSPKEFAVIAAFAALDCTTVWFVYGRYARRLGYDNSLVAIVAMMMWLVTSLKWLPVGRS